MPQFEERLTELMQASGEIAEYVTGLRFIDRAESIDGITENAVLNSCFLILIDRLKIEGIELHVEPEDVLSDFYNAKFLITMYDVCTPDRLRNIVADSPDMIAGLTSIVTEFGDNEMIREVMRMIMNHLHQDEFTNMHTFLFDKVISTKVYSTGIRLLLGELLDDEERSENSIETSIDSGGFLTALMEERRELISRLNGLSEVSGDHKIDINFLVGIQDRLLIELMNTEYHSSLNMKYFSTLSVPEPVIDNPALENDFADSISSISKEVSRYYPYFEVGELFPDNNDCVMIMLTAIGVNNIFGPQTINLDDFFLSFTDGERRESLKEIYSVLRD